MLFEPIILNLDNSAIWCEKKIKTFLDLQWSTFLECYKSSMKELFMKILLTPKKREWGRKKGKECREGTVLRWRNRGELYSTHMCSKMLVEPQSVLSMMLIFKYINLGQISLTWVNRRKRSYTRFFFRKIRCRLTLYFIRKT